MHDLEQICVDQFRSSSTRRQIFDGLQRVVARIQNASIRGDLWINGSFLTKKMNPQDVDVVLLFSNLFYDLGTPEQKNLLESLNDNLRDSDLCDSYVLPLYNSGHPLYSYSENLLQYWTRQFGFSRGNDIKGIAVIELR